MQSCVGEAHKMFQCLQVILQLCLLKARYLMGVLGPEGIGSIKVHKVYVNIARRRLGPFCSTCHCFAWVPSCQEASASASWAFMRSQMRRACSWLSSQTLSGSRCTRSSSIVVLSFCICCAMFLARWTRPGGSPATEATSIPQLPCMCQI